MARGSAIHITRRIGPCLTPYLSTLLGAPLHYRPVVLRHDEVEAVVGWGLKGVFARDAAWAARHGLPYLALEDGFLRSVRPADGDAALSVSVDPVGVYYDAHRPSKLEQDIARARHRGTRARRTPGRGVARRPAVQVQPRARTAAAGARSLRAGGRPDRR